MDREIELPLFPLTQVVLFPGVRCPLHVFEPRYRQMTEAALAGDGLVGMATVRPEHADETAGDPPLFQVGCAGRIVDSARHPDGRFDIVLAGTWRFRIREELPPSRDRLFRVARAQVLPEGLGPGDGPRLAGLRRQTLARLGHLVERASGGERHFDPAPFAELDDATLTNVLCQLIDLEPVEKQGLLEEERVASRLEQLSELLAFREAALGSPPDPGRTVH